MPMERLYCWYVTVIVQKSCDGAQIAYAPTDAQADYNNHIIRRLDLSSLMVTTIAGQRGNPGSANGVGTAAQFSYPNSVTMNAAGTIAVIVSVD